MFKHKIWDESGRMYVTVHNCKTGNIRESVEWTHQIRLYYSSTSRTPSLSTTLTLNLSGDTTRRFATSSMHLFRVASPSSSDASGSWYLQVIYRFGRIYSTGLILTYQANWDQSSCHSHEQRRELPQACQGSQSSIGVACSHLCRSPQVIGSRCRVYDYVKIAQASCGPMKLLTEDEEGECFEFGTGECFVQHIPQIVQCHLAKVNVRGILIMLWYFVVPGSPE